MGLRRPVVIVEHHHRQHHAARHHHHDAVEVRAWKLELRPGLDSAERERDDNERV